MDRDIELRIKGHLYEIPEVNDESLDSRQGYPISEDAYRKTLGSVLDVAGLEMVDKVAALAVHPGTRRETNESRRQAKG